MTYEHQCRIRVRYADTDQMQVVHHANYLAYMEEARTVMLEELGSSYAEFERQGAGLAVRRVEIRYRAPARYGDRLLVRTRVALLRKASVLFSYTIESGESGHGSILAEGSTELACVDLGTLRPQALPESLVAVLRPLLADPGS